MVSTSIGRSWTNMGEIDAIWADFACVLFSPWSSSDGPDIMPILFRNSSRLTCQASISGKCHFFYLTDTLFRLFFLRFAIVYRVMPRQRGWTPAIPELLNVERMRHFKNVIKPRYEKERISRCRQPVAVIDGTRCWNGTVISSAQRKCHDKGGVGHPPYFPFCASRPSSSFICFSFSL